jgi:hypothetical protein
MSKTKLLRLLESKALGDYRGLRDRDLILRAAAQVPRAVANRIAARAEEDMDRLVLATEQNMLSMLTRYRRGTIPAQQLARSLHEILTRTYFEIFAIGARAAGNPKVPAGWDDLTRQESDWIHGALQTEFQYLDKLVKGLVTNKDRWSVPYMRKRLRAYAQTAKAMFEAGRVAGLSPLNIIEWEARSDRGTCRECLLLRDFGPYLRHTLPTTPKAGHTRCLNNCRCTLRIHPASEEQVRVLQAMAYDKQYYLRLLDQSRSRPDNLPRTRGRVR